MIRNKWQDGLFDAWCVCSIVGVWPRFIEPRILKVNRISIQHSKLSKALFGLKIVHFSDLHYSASFSPYFKEKIIKKINDLSPDYIFFTGDFICRSVLSDKEGLRDFLNRLKANLGCFCVLGNHDYSEFVTVNDRGDYDIKLPCNTSNVKLGLHRLFSSTPVSKAFTERTQRVNLHQELCDLLRSTPFQLLHNQTLQLSPRGSSFNLCGLGEYMCKKFSPETAFKSYDAEAPGIILVHNPDTIACLKDYPGDLILAGHTHGGQVNFPLLWKRFTRMEHVEYKSGLKHVENKEIYVNRGLGSVMPFRWCASPEITLYTFGEQ